MAASRRAPPRKSNPYAYGTPSYFAERERQLAERLRELRRDAKRGSKAAKKAAATKARETERKISKARESADLAARAQQQIRAASTGEPEEYRAERRKQRVILRSFNRLPASERQQVETLLATYRDRPMPRDVPHNLSPTAMWLFFRAGGQTG